MGGDTFEDADQIDRLAVGQLTGRHGTAADEEGGDVAADRAHQHAGNDLVAVGNADDRIEAVGLENGFDRVGDDFAAGQGIFHPGMPHGDAVADTDGVELEGHAARFADGFLDDLAHLIEVGMTGNDLGVGVADRDEGLVEIFGFQSGGAEEAAVWRALPSLFDLIATHGGFLLVWPRWWHDNESR